MYRSFVHNDLALLEQLPRDIQLYVIVFAPQEWGKPVIVYQNLPIAGAIMRSEILIGGEYLK